MEQVPYEETTPSDWDAVIDSWTWDPEPPDGKPTGWRKSGQCPRCQHDISITLGHVVAIFPIGARPAYCNCSIAHLQGVEGCGARGLVSGPPAIPPHR